MAKAKKKKSKAKKAKKLVAKKAAKKASKKTSKKASKKAAKKSAKKAVKKSAKKAAKKASKKAAKKSAKKATKTKKAAKPAEPTLAERLDDDWVRSEAALEAFMATPETRRAARSGTAPRGTGGRVTSRRWPRSNTQVLAAASKVVSRSTASARGRS